MIGIRKLIITHFLLNLYLLVLVQPGLPVLEYMINYNYIVNELCENRDKPVLACNGKCYLGNQIEKQLDLDGNTQLPIPPKYDSEKFVTLHVNQVNDIKKIDEVYIDEPIFFKTLKEAIVLDINLRPPIV